MWSECRQAQYTCPDRPARLWKLLSQLFNGHRGFISLHQVQRSRMSGAILPLPLYAFMVCKGIQQFKSVSYLGEKQVYRKKRIGKTLCFTHYVLSNETKGHKDIRDKERCGKRQYNATHTETTWDWRPSRVNVHFFYRRVGFFIYL
jgi:hypothetical protein